MKMIGKTKTNSFLLILIILIILTTTTTTTTYGSELCICPINTEMDIHDKAGGNGTIIVTAVNACVPLVENIPPISRRLPVNISSLIGFVNKKDGNITRCGSNILRINKTDKTSKCVCRNDLVMDGPDHWEMHLNPDEIACLKVASITHCTDSECRIRLFFDGKIYTTTTNKPIQMCSAEDLSGFSYDYFFQRRVTVPVQTKNLTTQPTINNSTLITVLYTNISTTPMYNTKLTSSIQRTIHSTDYTPINSTTTGKSLPTKVVLIHSKPVSSTLPTILAIISKTGKNTTSSTKYTISSMTTINTTSSTKLNAINVSTLATGTTIPKTPSKHLESITIRTINSTQTMKTFSTTELLKLQSTIPIVSPTTTNVPFSNSTTPPQGHTLGCQDDSPVCSELFPGECEASIHLMIMCHRSCGVCGVKTDYCADHSKDCSKMINQCSDIIIQKLCPSSCNLCDSHTCNKTHAKYAIDNQSTLSHPVADYCSDGTHTNTDSVVLGLCEAREDKMWSRGIKVIDNCGKIQLYAPVSSFGSFSHQMGIFLGCTSAGFKIGIQKCHDHLREYELVTGNTTTKFSNAASYYILIVK